MKRTPKFILACLACVTLFTSGITANAIATPGMGVTSSTVDTGAARSTAGLTDNRLGSYSTAYNDYGTTTTNAIPRDTLYRGTTANNVTRDARNYDSAKLPGVATDSNTPNNRGTAINTDNNISGRYGTDGNSRTIGTNGRDSMVHRRHHTDNTINRSTINNRGTMATTDGNVNGRYNTTDGSHRSAVTGRNSTVHRNHGGHHTIGTPTPSNRGTAIGTARNTDGNRANVTTDRNSMVHRSHTNHTAATHTPSNRGTAINTDNNMDARHNNTDGNHRTTVVGNNPIVSRADRNERNLAGSGTRNVFRNTRRDDGHGYHRYHMRNWFENDVNRGNYRAYGDGYVNPNYRGGATTTNVHRGTRTATEYTNDIAATPVVRGRTTNTTTDTTVAPRFTTNPTRTATTRGVYRNTTVTESRNATITFVVLLVAIAALLALAIYALTRTRHDRITNTSFSDNEHVNRRR